ncbi:MAG TPA: TolC family protein [Methylomirabilota bacterium]|nr:TolC family protein [Methylomirabilota bacterium]
MTPLALEDAVRSALERNLDLSIQRVQPLIGRQQIRQAIGAFDPLLELSAVYNHQERFVNSLLEQAAESGLIISNIFTPGGSLSGKLTTGTQYAFSLTAPSVSTNDPNRLFDQAYQAVMTLGLTQPLLRDFGTEVNLVQVRQAENVERQNLLAVEAKMLSLILDVETRYWALVYAQGHVDVSESAFALAQDLVVRTERQRRVGRATDLDVLQTRTAAEARRGELARARADLLNAQAQLRLLIDPKAAVGGPIVAGGRPRDEGSPVDLVGKLGTALARRPEIRQQELVIEKLALSERLDKNNTLPRLDALGSLGWNGLAGNGLNQAFRGTLPSRLQGQDTYTDAFNNFLNPNGNVNWLLGLRLQFPIGNKVALAQLEQTRLSRRQEELRLALLKSQIAVDVETAFNDLGAAAEQLQAARQAVSLASEQVDAEERKLPAGLSTVRTALETHNNLAIARDREVQALTTYASVRSRLDATQALPFETYRLVVGR